MKSAEFERLLSNLRGDDILREEFRRLGDLEQTMHLAAAKGYRLTRQEAEELLHSFQELSDEDLDKAAGGAWNDPPPPGGTGG
jgi:predicted ribosomally synthesized peptide with nif11-like leader